MNTDTLLEADSWAEETFRDCELGDKRRTRRVIKMASQLATHTGRSLAGSCEGEEKEQEGAYRWVRNIHVKYQDLLEGGYAATLRHQSGRRRVLEIPDTTTLSYRHTLSQQLGDLGGPAKNKGTGLWVHSSLLVDADSEQTLGLIEQQYWKRAANSRGQRHRRKARSYEEKESFKWQRASERVSQRLGEAMSKVITVCDREADVFEYLHYKGSRAERFIVRAAQDRGLWDKEKRLFEQVSELGKKQGKLSIQIPQRGGRRARRAVLHLRSAKVTLCLPKHSDEAELSPVTVNVVLAQEQGQSAERLSWMLLTSESIQTPEQVQDVLRCYGLRWRIEEFHKAWKSGAGVEELRMQYEDNLQRMAVLLAFVAVRLLQLRETLDNPGLAQQPCSHVLGEQEWKILWFSTQRKKSLPDTPLTLAWAYRAIAKLGGFTDTKRTGRASWETIWIGWARLNERIHGYQILKEAGF